MLEIKVTLDARRARQRRPEAQQLRRHDLRPQVVATRSCSSSASASHIKLGYVDDLVSVLRGPITTLSPEFVSDGAPTLTVACAGPPDPVAQGPSPRRTGVTYKNKKRLADRQARSPTGTTCASSTTRTTTLRPTTSSSQPKHRRPRVPHGARRADRLQGVHARSTRRPATDVLHFGKPHGRARPDAMPHLRARLGQPANNTGVAPSLIEFKPTITDLGPGRSR